MIAQFAWFMFGCVVGLLIGWFAPGDTHSTAADEQQAMEDEP